MNDLDDVISDLRGINKRLLEGFLFLPSFEGLNDSAKFFDNVNLFKLDSRDIVILSLSPDGDDTVIGRFMTRDRDIYFFDFDLEDYEYSRLTKVDPQGKPDEFNSLRNSEFLEEIAGSFLLEERA